MDALKEPSRLERIEQLRAQVNEARNERNKAEQEAAVLRGWAWAWGATALIAGWAAMVLGVYCWWPAHP